MGTVKVEAALSHQNIEQKHFLTKYAPSRRIGEHTIISYQIQHPGEFYFQVTAEHISKNSPLQKPLYMVIPHVLKTHQPMPHDVFYAPDEGFYRYKILNYTDRTIKITFPPLQVVNEQDLPYKPKYFVYILHVTNRTDYLNLFTQCDLEISDLAYFGVNSDQVFHYTDRLHLTPDENKDEDKGVFTV